MAGGGGRYYASRRMEFETVDGEERRDQIMAFIREFKRTHDGCSPTLKLIGDAVYLCPQGVSYHLEKLERDGEIVRYRDLTHGNIGLRRNGSGG